MSTEWNRRFFDSTRGSVVLLLRQEERTVNELAGELGLTDNAVRAQLAMLERDGLVERAGQRRGPGKPSYAYRLTDGARFLFPQAYDSILVQLLETIAGDLGSEQSLDILRATGRRLAQAQPHAAGDLDDRVAQAANLIAALGGMVDVSPHDEGYEMQGTSCPFSSVVSENEEFCALVEAFLQSYIGAPVSERCHRNGQPRCCFDIARAGAP